MNRGGATLRNGHDGGFGIYVHWPFCLAKCPYCDFNSHVREAVDERRWRAALGAELDHFAASAPGRTVTSMFFGGGTPSLVAPATVATLIDRVAHHWSLADDIEITLEANPTSVEARRFAGYRAGGVNRVSLGVQSLNDDVLRFLGRGHDVAQARCAVEVARRTFPRISIDLIYARPGQTSAQWSSELVEAVALANGHVSAYQLTIERGTAFFEQVRRGAFAVPDDETAAQLYDTTQEVLAAAGMPAYEVSNHAAPGAQSRHNVTYWRAGEFIGVGPGAHGRLLGSGVVEATRQIRSPERWIAAVERRGHGTRERARLSDLERVREVLMMGLRLREGVPRARFRARTGRSLDDALVPERVDPLVEEGLIEIDDGGIRATIAGWRVLDSVLAALVA